MLWSWFINNKNDHQFFVFQQNFDNKEKAYQDEISQLQHQLRQTEYDRQSEPSLKKTKSAVCSIL